MTLAIRPASPEDAADIAAIYAPYVERSVVTFEEEVPDAETMAERIVANAPAYPWIVGVADGALIGYAYARPFHPRAAYRWTCETSIYLAENRRGAGSGRALYAALLERLTTQGFASAIALISVPNAESTGFHEAFGFREIGQLRGVGYKLGAWRDVAYYQRDLAPRTAYPAGPQES